MAAPAAEKPADAAKPAEAAANGAGGGGIKAMMPLILNIVLMPAIAFAMTQFVILPKLNSKAATGAHGDSGAAGDEAAADAHGDEKADSAHGDEKADKGHGDEKADKAHGDEKADKGHGDAKPTKGGKILVPLSQRIIVNVAGTMGTRYLAAGVTLVGTKSGIKKIVEEHMDQLRDAISAALSNKSILDLERPGSRNLIRSELVTVCNSVLGDNWVMEVYLTEFAVQ